jgi:hypothetical protein
MFTAGSLRRYEILSGNGPIPRRVTIGVKNTV